MDSVYYAFSSDSLLSIKVTEPFLLSSVCTEAVFPVRRLFYDVSADTGDFIDDRGSISFYCNEGEGHIIENTRMSVTFGHHIPRTSDTGYTVTYELKKGITKIYAYYSGMSMQLVKHELK